MPQLSEPSPSALLRFTTHARGLRAAVYGIVAGAVVTPPDALDAPLELADSASECGAQSDTDRALNDEIFKVSHLRMCRSRRLRSAPMRTEDALQAFEQLMLNETLLQPSPAYVARLGEEARMQRASLMQWVMEVCESFSMAHVSQGCVLNYLERAIEHTTVPGDVSLFGVAAVLIGSKFCEIHPVHVGHLQQCASEFTCEQIRQMERDMLQVLQFQLDVVTTHHFVNLLLQLVPEHVRLKIRKYVELLVDLTMLDAALVGHKRSMIACTAMHIALKLCDETLPEIDRYYILVASVYFDNSKIRLEKTFNHYFPPAHTDRQLSNSPQSVVQAANPEVQVRVGVGAAAKQQQPPGFRTAGSANTEPVVLGRRCCRLPSVIV